MEQFNRLKSNFQNLIRRFHVYFLNTSWLAGEKIFSLGLAFIVGILVSRYLGPSHFGLLAYALSLGKLFSRASHLGLSGLVVREIVREPGADCEIIGTVLGLKLAGSVFGFAALLLFAELSAGKGTPEFLLIVVTASALLFHPFQTFEFWFQARVEGMYIGVARGLSSALSALFSFGLVLLDSDLWVFAFTNVLQNVLTGSLLFMFFFKARKRKRPRFVFSRARSQRLLREGSIVFMGALFASLYLRMDQVMIKWMVGSDEVGIYAVAASLSEVWYFLPSAIAVSVFPRLVGLRDSDPGRYTRAVQSTTTLLFLTGLAIAVLVTLTAGPVIRILYGEAYQASASILSIHIWAGVFIFMRAVFSKWILVEKQAIFSPITHGMGALLNLALNFILIPEFGGQGAAWATLVSYSVASYFSLALFRQTRPMFLTMSRSMLAPFRVARIFQGKYK